MGTSLANGSVEIAAAFQGGGAKAVAYAGALRALEGEGYKFRALAGTSAGAIVASLVASGHSPSEIEALIPVLLSKITKSKPRILSPLPDVRETGLYSLEQVRRELETRLRAKLRSSETDDQRDVTFQELTDKTGVELNILVTVSPGKPGILNSYTAPTCQVSYAVAASSAIPVVMHPQVFEGVDSLEIVVDGGVWANFPSLCFTDRSLRYYYRAPELDEEYPVVGFVLDTEDDLGVEPARPRSRVERLSSRLKSVGLSVLRETAHAALSARVLTFLLTGFLLAGGAAVGVYWIWFRSEGSIDPMSIVFGLLLSFILLWIGVLGLALAKASDFVPALIQTLPTLIRGATAVTTGIPEWIGAHPETRVIRVPASKHVVDTTSFTLSDSQVRLLVDRAERLVRDELRRVPLGQSHPGRRAEANTDGQFVALQKLPSLSDFETLEALLPGAAFNTALGALLGFEPRKRSEESGVGEALRKLGMR